MSTLLEGSDFTLYQSGGKLMSGDFEINQNGGDSDLLKNLAIPLYYFSKGGKKNYHKYDEPKENEDKIIDNDLFDKLLKMVEHKDEKNEKRENVNKKRGTKKHKDTSSQNKKKKTKKNK
jgi:hypothetical protein